MIGCVGAESRDCDLVRAQQENIPVVSYGSATQTFWRLVIEGRVTGTPTCSDNLANDVEIARLYAHRVADDGGIGLRHRQACERFEDCFTALEASRQVIKSVSVRLGDVTQYRLVKVWMS